MVEFSVTPSAIYVHSSISCEVEIESKISSPTIF